MQRKLFSSSISIINEKISKFELHDLVESQFPIILKGFCDDWPAVSDSTRKWSIDTLKERIGHYRINIEAHGNYMQPDMKLLNLQVADFLEYIQKKNPSHFYLAQQDLENFPEIENDILKPSICFNTFKKTLYRTNIWIGPRKVASPCHYDPFHNMLCQVIGEKRVVLFHPSDIEYLYPAVHTVQKNTSLVDIDNPDLKAFPLFSKAKPIEIILQPSDALYIPIKYFHYCASLSTSCSVNFWWL